MYPVVTPVPTTMTPLYKEPFHDIERGGGVGSSPPGLLYPTIAAEVNALRWSFIRKVYTILSIQLLLTTLVAGVVSFYRPATLFLLQTPGLFIFFTILPLILICPLYYYHQKHPINLFLLALFTVSLSLSVGFTCAFTNGKVISASALMTTVVVVSLTLYTFWAASRGYDFNFLGPMLFTALVILIVFIIIQIFFPMGRLSIMIYGAVASLVFSGFIIYDTDNLIKRYNYDEYIWASVALYLDIINLFLALLTLFRGIDSS